MNGKAPPEMSYQRAPKGRFSTEKTPFPTLLSSRSGVRVLPGVPSLLSVGSEELIVKSEEVWCAFGTILISRLRRHITYSLFTITSNFKYGGCSSIGRAPDCGSGRCGFESHYPPHKFRFLLEIGTFLLFAFQIVRIIGLLEMGILAKKSAFYS